MINKRVGAMADTNANTNTDANDWVITWSLLDFDLLTVNQLIKTVEF